MFRKKIRRAKKLERKGVKKEGSGEGEGDSEEDEEEEDDSDEELRYVLNVYISLLFTALRHTSSVLE